MRTVLTRLVLLLLMSLAGCAFQSALDRGHMLVGAQRYRAALSEYERALSLDPDSEQARRLVAQLKPYAIEEAEDEAAAAIAEGRYEHAVEIAKYVHRLDAARAEALRGEVARWMRAGVEGSMAERRMEDAYPLAVRTRRLFPAMEGLDGVFSRLRAHFHDRSDRALAAGDFSGALVALDVIERHEPDQGAALAPKRQEIRGRWADDEVARGEAAENEGHLGVAAVHYARAHEIAQRASDVDRMHASLRILEREGRFALALRFEGDPERKGVLSRIEAGARATEGVRLAGDDVEAATMLAVVRAEPVLCAQAFSPVNGQQEYVAGTRLVDNPRYLELDAAVAAIGAEVDRLALERARLEAEASGQSREARACERREVQPAARRLEGLRRQLADHEARVASLEARVEALRDEIFRLRDPEARARKERELAKVEEQLARARTEAAEAASAVAAQQSAVDAAQARCRSLAEAAAQAETAALEAQARLASQERELARLENERRATPRQLSEPIIEIFHYEIRRFTRTCEGAVAVDLEPAWTRGERRMVPTSRTTSDDTHPAHPRYGVAADPLRFPLGDRDLRAGADEDAAAAVLAMLTGFVRDYYASMTDRASEMAASDTATATDMMVALLTAAPEQLTPKHRERIAAHLRNHYGLENVASLGR